MCRLSPCRFFDPPAVPGPMDELEEEEMQELQTALEEDYEIGWAGTVLIHCSRPCLPVTAGGARQGNSQRVTV